MYKIMIKGRDIRGNCGCYLRAQVLREALKISSPLALVSREVPRFHGGSLWHTTLALSQYGSSMSHPITSQHEHVITMCLLLKNE